MTYEEDVLEAAHLKWAAELFKLTARYQSDTMPDPGQAQLQDAFTWQSWLVTPTWEGWPSPDKGDGVTGQEGFKVWAEYQEFTVARELLLDATHALIRAYAFADRATWPIHHIAGLNLRLARSNLGRA